MPPPPHVIGIGASSIDFVYALPATPAPDSETAKLRISRHVVSPGGQTATVMCMCASLGLRATFVGTVGNDAHARTVLDALTRRGVDTAKVIVRQAASPYAVILVDERHGERIVLWDRHPDLTLRPADLESVSYADAQIVHVDDVDIEAAVHAARRARSAGVLVTSDIEGVSTATAALVDAVDVAIFAEHVPQTLASSQTVADALQRLRARPDQLLCVTLGARGAVLLAGGELYRVDGHRVPVIDTTGAGDVFRGAFITALVKGSTPHEALAFANAAAAASCMKLGAIGGIPTHEEIETVGRGQ